MSRGVFLRIIAGLDDDILYKLSTDSRGEKKQNYGYTEDMRPPSICNDGERGRPELLTELGKKNN